MVTPMSDVNGRVTNGHAGANGADGPDSGEIESFSPFPPMEEVPEAPKVVAELADSCVRFVERKLGVRLDYTPETLPLLDHYLVEARSEVRDKPELLALLVNAAGAYFGEVVRRRIPSWWHMPSQDDPPSWQIQAEPIYLSFEPVAVAYDALVHGQGEEEEGGTARLEIEEEDREALEQRLAELPVVDEDEYYALSTRLEVIDIAADVIKARMIENGLGDVVFNAEDYEG